MSAESRSSIEEMMVEHVGFSFKEEDLSPKLRREITEIAKRVDYYKHITSARDDAERDCTWSFFFFIVLIIVGLVTIIFIVGVVFFAFAVVVFVLFGRRREQVKKREAEARACWSDIDARTKKISGEAFNELSALHEAKVRPTVRHITVDFASIIQAARGKGIILDAVECPYCKGAVKIPQSGEYFECQHCGKTVYATKIFDKLKDTLAQS